MKQFLAIFTGSDSGPIAEKWKALDEAKRQERVRAGMAAWMTWANKNEKSIVVQGSPVGKTKQANPAGISDTKNNIAAYTIVQAESHEAAVRMFADHPHFTIFPGESVEVMECLPIPKMP